MSRWITPASCAACSARATRSKNARVSASSSAPRGARRDPGPLPAPAEPRPGGVGSGAVGRRGGGGARADGRPREVLARDRLLGAGEAGEVVSRGRDASRLEIGRQLVGELEEQR